ncbi:hypothetical protein ACN6Q9_14970, partial [Acinetobacter baumannii]|uniref:hypothetical protein n=1 Tax=Acinetobacter baumannii TaxID=470 RepID=UPI003AFA35D0
EVSRRQRQMCIRDSLYSAAISMIFFMHLIGMNSIKNKMTLASRLDTTCRVLFRYSYRKISEA